MLRDHVLAIITGTAFVVVGVAAGLAAAARRRSGARVLLWLGLWSGMYGMQELARTPVFVAALPSVLRGALPLLNVATSYLILVAALLVWWELTQGMLKRVLAALAAAALVVAAAGTGIFLLGIDAVALRRANVLLGVAGLLILLTTTALPTRLTRRYLVRSQRGVLLAGTLVFAVEALYSNLARTLGLSSPHFLDWVGFAVLLFSFGYVALQGVVERERRLLSIESELDVARRLQQSILPAGTPELTAVRIAAAYEPMTAVAGDFYEFLPVDSHRAGLLVADVSGHGVPAALVASMVKVAVHSVADWAHDPGELLRRLGRALQPHLRHQYVTAAYLWIDTGTMTARYSAAGHPPLLHCRGADGATLPILSNGLLFGVVPESEYPVCEVAFDRGDRFVLYTDGLTEPENAAGEPFGDRRLANVLRECRSDAAEAVSRRLLAELEAWTPRSLSQQDDITLLVVDVR